MKTKRDYYKSMDRFMDIDGDNYGGCLKQVFDLSQAVCVEWRIEKATNEMHIIEYYEDGQGYTIYRS